MGLFSCFCAGPAPAEVAWDTANPETSNQSPKEVEVPETRPHEVVSASISVSGVLFCLSGISGTSWERAALLLAVIQRSPAVSLASLYAVPTDDDGTTMVLIGRTHGDADPTQQLPVLADVQQTLLFLRMATEKAPLMELLDRTPAGIARTAAAAAAASPWMPESSPSAQQRPEDACTLTRVAAVPLMHGTRLAGALWLEEAMTAPTAALGVSGTFPSEALTCLSGTISSSAITPFTITANSAAINAAASHSVNTYLAGGVPVGASGTQPLPRRLQQPQLQPLLPSLFLDRRALQSLGFACSMCLLGADAGEVGWLAGALSSLDAAVSVQELGSELVAALTAHVRRRFVLESHVCVALVPPSPQQQQQQQQPHGQGQGQGGQQKQAQAQLALLLLQQQPGIPASSTPAAALDTSGCNTGAMDFADHSISGRATAVDAVAVAASAASRRRLRMTSGLSAGQWTPTTTSGLRAREGGGVEGGGTPLGNVRSLRISLDLNLAGGNGGGASPMFGPRAITPLSGDGPWPRNNSMTMQGTQPTAPSSRSVVIPLSTRELLSAAVGGGSGTVPGGVLAAAGLTARAFPMQRTLLAAALAATAELAERQRQQQRSTAGAGVSAPAANASTMAAAAAAVGPFGIYPNAPASTVAGADAADAATAAAASLAVIEDTSLYVQNIHSPSADVVLLLGLRHAATTNGTFTGAAAAAAAIPGSAAGCSAAAAPQGLTPPPSPPQSLVLLTMQLEGGAVLGLYVCFARRLPAALLEAVRSSCQELVEQVLGPVFRAKLGDRAIAPEYSTLCTASPGSYAIVRSPSCNGTSATGQQPLTQLAMALPSLNATLISTGGDLAAALGMYGDGGGGEGSGGDPTTATTADGQPEPLSSGGDELSTADVDLLLAGRTSQAPQHGDGGSGGGMAQGAAALVAKRELGGRSRRMSLERAIAARRSAGTGAGASFTRHTPASVLAPATTSTSQHPVRNGQPTAAGRHPVASAYGAAAAANPAVPVAAEAIHLSELLSSNPIDVFAGLGGGGGGGDLGSHDLDSTRSFAGLMAPGLEYCYASILTVESVAPAGTARQQLDLLVSSIQATINTDPGVSGANGSPIDDLDALELRDVLGKGGGGIVFMGRLGTLDVAVKLMELTKADPAVEAAASQQQQQQRQQQHQGRRQLQPPPDADPAAAAAAADKASLNARREMLRNAMELAVQSRISHPNIVQIYSTYNNVVLIPTRGTMGKPGGTARLSPAPEPGSAEAVAAAAAAAARPPPTAGQVRDWSNVPCVAAAFELCDGGCLGSLLATRNFPRSARGAPARNGFGADMKGVFMVLLDVALALRHLHSMNLVHRDLKPANLVLKSNPRDYRGFTVKLADFGFVLHLSETAPDGSRFVVADQACGTVTHMAVEAMLGRAKIDASVDVFSFGILMWEMFSGGVRPYPQVQPDSIPRLVYKGARPTFADEVPLQYRSLAAACWSHLPERRPKAHELVSVLNNMLQELEQS